MEKNDKKRCNNFTKDEIHILVDLVELHKDIIECKKTDCVTNATKEAEWSKVAIQFNVVSGTGRTGKMLRSKWDSLKKTTKKEYADMKIETYKTGGGPYTDVKLTGVSSRVLALIGIAAKGTESAFDSDAAFETPGETTAAVATQSEGIGGSVETLSLQTPFMENVATDAAVILETIEVIEEIPSQKWDSWNPALLRQPKHPALQIGPSTSKIDKADDLCLPKDATPTKEACKKKKTKRANITPHHERNIYEDLARKKMEFLDFQKTLLGEEARQKEKREVEIHALKMRIMEEEHNLKMKLLEADLQNKTK